MKNTINTQSLDKKSVSKLFVYFNMRYINTFVLTLFIALNSFSQDSQLIETYSYDEFRDFNSVSSSQETATGTVFDDIDIIINYTVLENVDGGRLFKDVSVYSSDLCTSCELDVEFSKTQYHKSDVLSEKATIFLKFGLVKENKTKEYVKARLVADGLFELGK